MSEWKRSKWAVSESPDRLPCIVVEVEGEPTLMVSDRVFNGFAQLIVEAVNAYLSSDILENLEGKTLDELRTIRKALGHDNESDLSSLRYRPSRRLYIRADIRPSLAYPRCCSDAWDDCDSLNGGKEMKYFLIRNSDGDVYVTEFTKEELLAELDDGGWRSDEFLDELPKGDTNYWGERKVLLIKGEIVTPQKKEVVTKHDLP